MFLNCNKSEKNVNLSHRCTKIEMSYRFLISATSLSWTPYTVPHTYVIFSIFTVIRIHIHRHVAVPFSSIVVWLILKTLSKCTIVLMLYRWAWIHIYVGAYSCIGKICRLWDGKGVIGGIFIRKMYHFQVLFCDISWRYCQNAKLFYCPRCQSIQGSCVGKICELFDVHREEKGQFVSFKILTHCIDFVLSATYDFYKKVGIY